MLDRLSARPRGPRRLHRCLALALLALAALPPAHAALPAADDELIVRLRSDAALLRQQPLPDRADARTVRDRLVARARALAPRAGRELVAADAIDARTQVLRLPGASAAQTAAAMARLAADPQVESVERNGRMRRLAAPNDPLYPASATETRSNGTALQPGPASGQWYLRAPGAGVVSGLNVEGAWARTRGRAEMVVAVLDSGVRFEHPDLGRAANGGQLLPGYDFVSNATVANDGNERDADPSDPGDWVSSSDAAQTLFRGCDVSSSSWHGTTTASLVAAATDNGLGMAGAAPGVKVLPVRVLGKCFGYDSDIIAGMRWAAGLPVPGVPDNPNPARVINLSLGASGSCSASYQAAVNEIVARGVVIVAAAGNSAGGAVGNPANCSGVIAVLALRHAGTKVGFSDLGPEITVAAPGGNCINITAGSPCLYPILGATNTGSFGPAASAWTDSYNISVGTSFASPLVAGVAALMLSQQPALTPAQVRAAMQATARPFPSSGADNGPDDPTPVAQCTAPRSGVQQLQCYCSTALCGAGMLDAGAAVAAVAAATAVIELSPTVVVAGNTVTLSSSASQPSGGATITAWDWRLVDGGGIVAGFASATNAPTATLTPNAAGSFTVRLTVTDSLGASGSATLVVAVASPPSNNPTPAPTPDPGGGGGGGGALGGGWALALLAAALALRAGETRRRGR